MNEIDCDYVKSNGGRVSWRMETLGAVLPHEYTHWDKLMTPAMGSSGSVDTAYGPKATREADKANAFWHAERYE